MIQEVLFLTPQAAVHETRDGYNQKHDGNGKDRHLVKKWPNTKGANPPKEGSSGYSSK
jgi:hypothetical protein